MPELLAHYGLTPLSLALLAGALIVAVIFECINGFHDAANAVAMVIYTKSMPPWLAVVWSGIWNFIGVNLGGIAVAFAIVHLLPVDLVVDVGSNAGLAMIFALLVSAVLWNFATWYKGLPASSTHTLIGAIIGVGLANALLSNHRIASQIQWYSVKEVALALFISPILGFVLSGLLLLLGKVLIKNPAMYEPVDREKPPPLAVRATMILTSTGVSFAHGSNDGQKGVGIIMLILIGILPAHFALDESVGETREMQQLVRDITDVEPIVQSHINSPDSPGTSMAAPDGSPAGNVQISPAVSSGAQFILIKIREIRSILERYGSINAIPHTERWKIRSDILELSKKVDDFRVTRAFKLTPEEKVKVERCHAALLSLTDYAPVWVILIVAFSIGLGTMIGWKRIVVTVGEKIGKVPLSYAQGTSAQTITMVTIGAADVLGLPVSTTHVVSSGVAGSITAHGSGLQGRTVRDIALAWLLTFPAAMILGMALFMLFRWLVP